MKKLIVAAILSVFAASTAYACDGKDHAKGDKASPADTAAKKDKTDKADQKS